MVKSIKRNNFLSAMKGVVITFVLMMTFILKVQNAYATESYTWSSAKIPGSDTTSSTTRTMTYYAGNVYFKATSLTSDASYCVAKCVGVDVTINNDNKCVSVSVVNVPVSFKVVPATDGRTTMKYNMYIVHNATTYQNAYGAGEIYY